MSAEVKALLPLELTGRAVTHVVLHPRLKRTLHPETAEAFLSLCAAAETAGHRLHLVSAFRTFDRQLQIWNEKWRGQRPLLDRQERPLDASTLSPEEKIKTILLWSALPGTSRHHWGSDLDVIDLKAQPANRAVDLLQSDFKPGGCFHALENWLASHADAFGFERPYVGSGTIQAEPWHLSHRSVSEEARIGLTRDLVAEALSSSALEGRDLVLQKLDDLVLDLK